MRPWICWTHISGVATLDKVLQADEDIFALGISDKNLILDSCHLKLILLYNNSHFYY